MHGVVSWLAFLGYLSRYIFYSQKNMRSADETFNPRPVLPADMFESVNKKTVVHPLFKVGLS